MSQILNSDCGYSLGLGPTILMDILAGYKLCIFRSIALQREAPYVCARVLAEGMIQNFIKIISNKPICVNRLREDA